ncbi:hypothetical protein QR680_000103 [Steinernema hermaphroditum]|uniref:Ubiquitin carboxyl-terminal hydrolase n=1 Tax=Steinernema hermaphroditum TaxID=289476 RepID=A0AA39GTC7_9BILA|nr:hypothetical protein QR680_000103 [Steinernema hermaphroditum]
MASDLNSSDSGNERDIADGEVGMGEEEVVETGASSADESSDGDKPTLHIIPIEALKRGEYEGSDCETFRIRIQLKDICISKVVFHDRRLQVQFTITTTQKEHAFLTKFKASPNDVFEWCIELFDDIVPGECSMIDGKELVLRKRDTSKRWTSSLATSTSLDMVCNGNSRFRDTSIDRASSVLSRCTLSSTPSATASTASYRRSKYTGNDYSRYSVRDCRTTYSPSEQFRSRSTSTLCRSSTMSTLDKRSNVFSFDKPSPPQIGTRLSASYHRDYDSPTFSGSSNSSPTKSKPTARVVPYDEPATAIVEPGYTGLRNMGNTCFMNATLQMLVNTAELKKYFLAEKYKMDVNPDNPLGFGGRLAEAFAEFMAAMWSGLFRTHEPKQIKNLVAEKASQFANYAQHDAQEFLSFLLDGLHEDLNRVRNKPLTGTVEANGRPDHVVTAEAWANHLRRNDSVIVDLFHGQLKSHLECPKCHHHSITFDPFMYLPLSLPKAKSTATVTFWPADATIKPRRLIVHYNADGNAGDFLSVVSDKTKIPSHLLKMAEVSSGKFQKIYDRNDATGSFLDSASLHIYEIRDESAYQEEIVQIYVVQRLLYNHAVPRQCAQCDTTSRSLKTCDRCYNVFYCSEKCQIENWEIHREVCAKRENSERVGLPFIVSVPRSQLSYTYLMHTLQFKCMHSVNVFELPHIEKNPQIEENDVPEPVPSTSTAQLKQRFTNGVHSSRKLYVPPEASKKAEHRLYLLRLVQAQDSFRGESLKSDSNEKIKKLHNEAFISVNWYNLRCGKEHLSVESKTQIDLDPEKSDKLLESRRFQRTLCPNLSDMLALFSEPEKLKPEEAWYCNRCKTHVEATKTMQLYRLPKILIIQLKRFVYSGSSAYSSLFSSHRRTKDDRMVQYPVTNLDLKKYLSPAAQPHQQTMYDLTGIVCHTGTSYYGHYVSIGRLTNESGTDTRIGWRNFDDGIVTDIRNDAQTETDEAYLLFYKQRG